MKKLLLIVVALVAAITLTACKPGNQETLTYTVTFDTDGGNNIAPVVVENGDKVTRPTDPVKEGYVFAGTWLHGTSEWNFDIDIVTEDITLVAEWIVISSTPTNIKMTDEPFSSNITWQQTDAELPTFTVSLKPIDGDTFTELAGTIDITDGEVIDTVVFTPDAIPQGGYYVVRIDTSADVVDSETLLFAGAGTQANPYLTSRVSDIVAILDDWMLADKHYLQVEDILMTLEDNIEINDDRKVTFLGVYDGDGHSLSFGGNGGLFHEIGLTGVVRNLVIANTTQLSASETNLYPIGTIADLNNGLIENIESSANLVNTRLQGELPVWNGTVDTSDTTTGAGGIVGINGATGIIRDVTVSGSGVVKTGRGNGGVAAYNYGLIQGAYVTATLPAGNQANSGKSSNTYSYGGGIAGFNFGTISESLVTGRVFAQSAYSTTADGNEGKNVGFGGIAGYNEGTITRSSFARSMDRKEYIDKTRAEELQDAANNLGVASIHGDLYVGGIAGINAGIIEHSYVGGALIGGRDFVGGVTGLTLGSGVIRNTYVFAEIAIKDEAGIKITTPTSKTTATTYDIAPSGFEAATVFQRDLINSVNGTTWQPGDVEVPMLPDFTEADYLKVGDQFSTGGTLLWQNGFVSSIDITLGSIVLPFGGTQTIEFTVFPSTAPDPYTFWSSSDENIVEIIGEGIIRGVSAGTATITATTRDGGYTDTIEVTVEDYNRITSVTVTSPELTLPNANDDQDRLTVDLDTVMTLNVDILPLNAEYQNYTITSTNSRALVSGNTVTFVYGLTGPGFVSIVITFEDASVGTLEYRFETYQEPPQVPVESVVVSSTDFTLPTPNNADDRPLIPIGSTVQFDFDFTPSNADYQNFVITTSNSRAVPIGDTVYFVYGLTSPGRVSVFITFEDPNTPMLEYRFETYLDLTATTPITDVVVTADGIDLPAANDDTDRPLVAVGTSFTFSLDIQPAHASNQAYTVVASNSRAVVDGNTVTFVQGDSGPGNVSIYFTFLDGTFGTLNYRFETYIPVE